MVIGLVSFVRSTTPSGGPYHLQVPTSTWTYLIDQFSNGSYYMVNKTNWKVDYQSTNLTKVEEFALGNMTSGTLYLMQVQHNSSLTVSSSVMVTEDYQGQISYYSNNALIYSAKAGSMNATMVRVGVLNGSTNYVQAYRLLVENGSSFPSAVSSGYLFFRTDYNQLCFYNGTDWTNCTAIDDDSTYLLVSSASNFLFQNGTRVLTGNWNIGGSYGVYGATWLNSTSLNALGFYWNGLNRTDAVANPISTASYIIDVSGSTYRMKNGTDGQILYQSTNLTKVEQFALGNMTSGLLYLKEVQFNSSLTLSDTQMVIQQFNGTYKSFNNQGSFILTVLQNDPSTSGWGQERQGYIWYNAESDNYKYWNGTQVIVLPSISGGTTAYYLPNTYTIYSITGTYYLEDWKGNTLGSNANCTKVMNCAIGNATVRSNPGTIFLTAGEFAVDSSFDIIDAYQKGLTIQGQGERVTEFNVTANLARALITFQNGGTVFLKDFSIQMNQKNGDGIYGDRVGANTQSSNIYGGLYNVFVDGVKAGYWGVHIINPSYMYSANLHIYSFGGALWLENNATGPINRGNSHFSYTDIELFGGNNVGIYLSSPNVGTTGEINLNDFENVQIQGINAPANSTGILLYDAAYNTFQHLCIEDVTYNIELTGVGSNYCKYNNFVDGVYLSTRGTVLLMLGNNARGNTFRDMYCIAGAAGSMMINESGTLTYDGNTYENVHTGSTTNWATPNIAVQSNARLKTTTGIGGTIAASLWSENYVSGANTTATTIVITHKLWTAPTVVLASFSSSAITGWSWTATSTQLTISVAGTLPASYTAYVYIAVQP